MSVDGVEGVTFLKLFRFSILLSSAMIRPSPPPLLAGWLAAVINECLHANWLNLFGKYEPSFCSWGSRIGSNNDKAMGLNSTSTLSSRVVQSVGVIYVAPCQLADSRGKWQNTVLKCAISVVRLLWKLYCHCGRMNSMSDEVELPHHRHRWTSRCKLILIAGNFGG